MQSARPDTTLATPEELLAHAGWLRALARSLVRDDAAADDLTQETWAAAVRSPPANDRPLRPWLSQVLRNCARGRFRRFAVGARLIERFAPGEAESSPSPEVLVERVETERMLTELVLALREPFRSTVLLRYFEGYAAADIARLQGVPAGTVRWRLKQGLDDLRAELARRHGGERAWVAVLAPLCGAWPPRLPARAAPLGAGKLLGPAAPLLAVLATVVVVGVLVRGRSTPAPAAELAPLAAPAPPRHDVVAWALDPAAARGAISGRVVGPDGRPVAGALVVAGITPDARLEEGAIQRLTAKVPPDPDGRPLHDAPDGFASKTQPAAIALSGPDGGFRLRGLRAAVYALTATAPGRPGAARAGLVVGPGHELGGVELALGREGVTVAGRLSDSGGGPIAGGTVHALPTHGAGLYAVTSDGDGRYQLTLPRGSYVITARADGYAPDATMAWLESAQQRDFRLHAAARLSGRVVARADGRPLADAEVHLLGTDLGSHDERRTTTDAAGRFVFADLDPGLYELSARKGGLTGTRPGRVAIPFAADVPGVDLELGAGRSVSGRVLWRGGAPVDRAVVVARLRDVLRSATPVIKTIAGADGRFTLTGLAPGLYQLEGQAGGSARAMRPLAVGASDLAGEELLLERGAEVTGRVLDRAGRPVGDATVSAWVLTSNSNRDHLESVRTGADGRFRLVELGAGELHLGVSHSLGSIMAAPVPLAAGDRQQTDLVIDAATVVRGMARHPDGRPAAGVEIRAKLMGPGLLGSAAPERVALSGSDGRYEIVGQLPGDVLVQAGVPGQGSAPVHGPRPNFRRFLLGAGEQRDGVDLTVPRLELAISGVVVDDAGQPVEGAVVSGGEHYYGTVWSRFRKHVTGPDGTFRITGLLDDLYTLWATHADHPQAESQPVRAGTSDVRIVFQRGGAIAGRVVNASGQPVTDYSITAFVGPRMNETADGRAVRMTGAGAVRLDVHDAGGAFAFERLRPGVYDLSVVAAGEAAVRAAVRLGPGERVGPLEITLAPSVTLRGRVVERGTGRPIALALVQGRGAGGIGLEATADEDGRFELAGVPARRNVELRITGQWQTHVREDQEVSTPAGGVHDLGAIALEPGKLDWFSPDAGLTGLLPVTRNGVVVVQSLRAGHPAELAGIRAGDRVLAVDGHDTSRAGASTVNFRLRGKEGAPVVVVVETPGEAPRALTLVRVRINGR